MKFYKKIIFGLLISLIAASANVKAQGNRVENLQDYDQKPYHFGFILSFNQMNFSLKTNENAMGIAYSNIDTDKSYIVKERQDSLILNGISNQPVFRFTVGIAASLKLNPYFDLRFVPSLAFGERKLNYSFSGLNPEDSLNFIDQQTISSTHIDFPLYIKFKSERARNFRAYVLGGVKYTLDLDTNSNKYIKLKSNDLLCEAGCGFEFYFAYFKFGIELKMSYGFNNLLKPEDNIYVDGIESLKSKLFQISFTFE